MVHVPLRTPASPFSRLAGGLFFALSAAALWAAPPQEALVAASRMDKAHVRAYLEFIASDELQGRYTPSLGLNTAARYIASLLAQWGVKPGGDKGGYFQSFSVPSEGEANAMTQNVIGIIPGQDPKLRDEYVVVSAHYDHLGMASEGQDRIYNGADDNGSGTVGLLEMARALSLGAKPKRSVMFLWLAGEERGLWGSRHFVLYPTVPLASITADVNIDMIGRSYAPEMGDAVKPNMSGPHEIFVIGARKMSDELGAIVDDVNKSYLALKYNTKFDDPEDPNRLFYRSDHYNFAQKGIPAVFFFDGLHPDYHQVTDEPKTIDYDKLIKVAQTVMATVWTIADRPARLKVDRPLPPG